MITMATTFLWSGLVLRLETSFHSLKRRCPQQMWVRAVRWYADCCVIHTCVYIREQSEQRHLWHVQTLSLGSLHHQSWHMSYTDVLLRHSVLYQIVLLWFLIKVYLYVKGKPFYQVEIYIYTQATVEFILIV